MSGTLTAAQEGVREGAVKVFVSVCLCAVPTCIRADEGEAGGHTDDILIGLRCQMPASQACQVSAARQGFRQGFRSPLAPPSAPTGIRCSSVVLPPLLTHKHPSSPRSILPAEHSEPLSTPVNLRWIQTKKSQRATKARASLCWIYSNRGTEV